MLTLNIDLNPFGPPIVFGPVTMQHWLSKPFKPAISTRVILHQNPPPAILMMRFSMHTLFFFSTRFETLSDQQSLLDAYAVHLAQIHPSSTIAVNLNRTDHVDGAPGSAFPGRDGLFVEDPIASIQIGVISVETAG